MPRREINPSRDLYTELTSAEKTKVAPPEVRTFEELDEEERLARGEKRSLKERVGSSRMRDARTYQASIEKPRDPKSLLLEEKEDQDYLSQYGDEAVKNAQESVIRERKIRRSDEEKNNWKPSKEKLEVVKHEGGYDYSHDVKGRDEKLERVHGSGRTKEKIRQAVHIKEGWGAFEDRRSHERQDAYKDKRRAERRESHRSANEKAAELMVYPSETQAALERFKREDKAVWNEAEDVEHFFDTYRKERHLRNTSATNEDLLEVDTDLALSLLRNFSKDTSAEAKRLRQFAEEVIIARLPEDPNFGYVITEFKNDIHFNSPKAVWAAVAQSMELHEHKLRELEAHRVHNDHISADEYALDRELAKAYHQDHEKHKEKWKEYSEGVLPRKTELEESEVSDYDHGLHQTRKEIEKIKYGISDRSYYKTRRRNRGPLARDSSFYKTHDQETPPREEMLPVNRTEPEMKLYRSQANRLIDRARVILPRPSKAPKYKTEPTHFRNKNKDEQIEQ